MVHLSWGDLNSLLRATLEPAVNSLYFSHTTNDWKDVNKSFSVVWPLNLNLRCASGPLVTALCSLQ